MAFIQCNLYSESLGMAVSVNVVLPQTTFSQIGMSGTKRESGTPVLYLLHGLSDDHTIWMRRTSIERYAAELGLAVVMPCVNRSFYCDTPDGMKFWKYVSEELPALVPTFFQVSSKREDTFVAGLSMGGFGAFKLAFNCPEKFAAAASLSGSLSNEWLLETNPTLFRNDFGTPEQLKGSVNDLYAKSEELVKSGKPRPMLYQVCGTEDFLYDVNCSFRDHLRKIGYDAVWKQGPGTHCWEFWDREIRDILKWLPIR